MLTEKTDAYHYGDLLQISGNLTRLPSGDPNSYGAYLDRSGYEALIYNPMIQIEAVNQGSPLLSWIFRIRSHLLEKVYQIYRAPENALVAGILLGDESQIPAPTEEAFRRTGTAHIIAISGMNFSVILWMLAALLKFFPNRWWRPLTLIPFIVVYAFMTGAKPAILRAAVMAATALFAGSIGRKQAGIDSLALTVTGMGLANPALFSDVGFQLSVFATLGILLFNPPVSAFFEKKLKKYFSEMRADTLLKILQEIMITSLSAQLLTTWIIAAAFHQFSPVSLIVNMLIAPIQTFLMLGGVISLATAMLIPPLGQVFGLLSGVFPVITIRIIELFSQIPWASVRLNLSWGAAWVIIAVLLIGWRMRNSLRRPDFKLLVNAALVILAAATVLVWQTALVYRDSSLTVKVNAAAGSSQLIIRTPSMNKMILAQGITGYQARELLQSGPFAAEPVRLAVIDLEKSWMATALDSFSDPAELTLFLNNRLNRSTARNPADTPEKITNGFEITDSDVQIRLIADHLRRKAWLIRYGRLSVLVPNGVPPQRVPLNALKGPVDFLILKRDESAERWTAHFAADQSWLSTPEILRADPAGGITFRSDGTSVAFFRE